MSEHSQPILQVTKKRSETTREANFEEVARLIERLVALGSSNTRNHIKWLRTMKGFVIFQDRHSDLAVTELVKDIFNCTMHEFEYRLRKCGFRVTEGTRKRANGQDYKVRVYRVKKTIAESTKLSSICSMEKESGSQMCESPQSDDFPRESEIEQLNLQKQQSRRNAGKVQEIKPEERDMQGMSIELKLREGRQFGGPIEIHVNQQELPALLMETNSFKSNYEKCHQLIDDTVLRILEAHKTKSIDKNSAQILYKITQIYDVLSENLENINSTAKFLLKKDTGSQ